MAVIGNTLSAIGDILYIYTQGAVAGQVQINSYTDVTVGVTPTRLFDKQFRYSLDGINYSNWEPLTNANLANVTGTVTSLLFFEFRYERIGTDPSGLLEFGGITLNGDIVIQICSATTTLESIFEDLVCSDALTSAICANLIKKIYKAGVLPKFMTRGPGTDDTDFISLWSAICCFLAFHSAFADEFDSVLYKRKYLKQYLLQKGIYYCMEEILFSELQFLANNFYDEIRKRGTRMTMLKKGTVLFDGSITEIDGEWLRVICRNRYDEFLVDVVSKDRHGFCIGNSSPIYNGNYKSKQINKTEENTEDILNLSLYDLQTPGDVSLAVDGLLNVASLKGNGSSKVGFGFDFMTPPPIALTEQLIIVDKEVDYEITFNVKRKAGASGTMWFGVNGYNRNGVYKPLSFIRIDSGVNDDLFFEDIAQDTTKIDEQWYSIRGVIYAADSPTITSNYLRTNVIGRNLRFNPGEDIDMVKPFIQIEGASASDEWLIHDFKMRPLIKGKNILPNVSTNQIGVRNPQFLQGSGMVMNWVKNNSDNHTDNQVHNIIQDYLLPYQQKLIPIFLEPKLDDKQLLL
jgi:hypothetical protein